jgi:hypothetical protein
MKEFKSGLLHGLGILTILFIFGVGVFSVNALSISLSDMPMKYESDAIDMGTTTKYVWIEDDPQGINDLSTNIDLVRKNGVIVGTYKKSYDNGKTFVDVPIIKDGYVITFKSPPLATDIEKLDLQMSLKNMKRDGGKTVIDKIADVKTTVDTLSTKVTDLETKVK